MSKQEQDPVDIGATMEAPQEATTGVDHRAVSGDEIRRLRAGNARRQAQEFEGLALFGGAFPDDPKRYGINEAGRRVIPRVWFAFNEPSTGEMIGQAPHDNDVMDSFLNECEERYGEAPLGVYCVVRFTPTERPGGGRGKFGLLDYCKLIGDAEEADAWLDAATDSTVAEETEVEEESTVG